MGDRSFFRGLVRLWKLRRSPGFFHNFMGLGMCVASPTHDQFYWKAPFEAPEGVG